MAGPVEHQAEAVAVRFFGEILFGYGGMFLKPFFGRPVPEVVGQALVDRRPVFPQLGCRGEVGRGVVRVGHEQLVEVGVEAFAEAEEGEHAVVDGGQVAQEIDDAVLSGEDLPVQVFVRKSVEESGRSFDGLFPGEEAGLYKKVLLCGGGCHDILC